MHVHTFQFVLQNQSCNVLTIFQCNIHCFSQYFNVTYIEDFYLSLRRKTKSNIHIISKENCEMYRLFLPCWFLGNATKTTCSAYIMSRSKASISLWLQEDCHCDLKKTLVLQCKVSPEFNLKHLRCLIKCSVILISISE